MPEEDIEEDHIGQDMERLSKDVEKVLEETERKFARCPKCGLPTHLGQDRRKAFCANCNTYYNVEMEDEGKKKLKKRDRRVSTRAKIAAGAICVAFLLLIGSFGYYFYSIESDPGYIDIHDVNEIRDLPKAEDVSMTKMSQQQLEIYLQETLDDETIKEIRRDEVLYKFLFIIPENWNLVDIIENESSGAGIAGLYDTEEEEMYVVGDVTSKNYVNSILSHEYTHALQDQNFDLDSIYPTGTHDGDMSMLCSVEGDAMMTMQEWIDRNLNEWEKIVLSFETLMHALSALDPNGEYFSSPILSELTYFPYLGGFQFVEKVYQQGGMDAVNDLFTERPVLSTEQVLHFDKYLDYERPVEVTFNGDTTGLDLQFTTTVGEKMLKEVLEYYLPDTMGSAALGWGGDSFYHYTSAGANLSILVTQWDSQEDNNHFAADYQNLLDYKAFNGRDIYTMGGNYAYMESEGSTTTIYYSDSLSLIERYK